jgi:SAM-dependent methyltransferase
VFSFELGAGHEAVDGPRSLAGETIDGRPHHSARLACLLDPWLGGGPRTLEAVPEHLERYLDRLVYDCIRLQRHVFLRLAHLVDAIGRIPEPMTGVLTVGASLAYTEAFLAGRLPGLRIVATGLERPTITFPMPNLQLGQLDPLEPPGPCRYDLVLSTECLERVAHPRAAFRNMVAMVRPGGYLYVSAPFASRGEQWDPDLRRHAWDVARHVTPGFAFEDLDEMFGENGVEVLHASNMLHQEVVLPVRRIIDRIDSAELECGAGELARLLLLDLRDQRVESCRQAEGIRVLGRRRAA